jgi:hypothetical protein
MPRSRHALLAALIAASTAKAATIPTGDGPPIQLDVTNTADFDYHFYQGNGIIAPQYRQTPNGPIPNSLWDPTQNFYFDWLNKLDTRFTYGPWHAELRLDSAVFGNVYPVDTTTSIQQQQLGLMIKMQNRFINNLVVEKVSVSYITPQLEITLGDFYINYGRGIILSLRKVDQLGVDTTLRGVNITGRLGNLSANFAGGITNNINTDQATASVAPDAQDPILAGRLEYRQPRLFAVSLEASDLNQNYDTLQLQPYPPAAPPSTDPLQCTSANHCRSVQVAPLSLGSVGALDQDVALPLWHQYKNFGGTLELPQILDHASAYFEYAHQWNQIQHSAITEGNAFYGGINFFAGPVTVQAELKDYGHFEGPVQSSLSSTSFPAFYQQTVYTNPPNLEEIWQEEITTNPLTIWGPRLRVDWQVNENLRPYIAGAAFGDNGQGVNIYYGMLGLEANWQQHRSHLNINGGLRYELLNEYAPVQPPSPTNTNVNQGESWAQYDIVQALTPIYSLELDGLHRNMNDCYGQNPCHAWTQGYAYLSLKRTSITVSGGIEYYTQDLNLYQPYYFNVSTAWIASEALLVRAFVGGREAGLRCINGICRRFPGFNGINLEIVAHY